VHTSGLVFGLVIGAAALAPRSAFAGDSFFDEGRAQAGLEKIFDKAGHPTKVLGVDIRTNQLIVELQAVDNPAHIDRYIDYIATDRIGRWFWPESISGPTPVQLSLPNPDIDANLFELKPADFAVVGKLAAKSVKQAGLEDSAQVDRMELRRALFLIPRPVSGDPEWSVEITSGREHAAIYATIAGVVTHADLRGTRHAQTLNYLAGGPDLDSAVAAAESTIGKSEVVQRLLVYDKLLSIDALVPGSADHVGGYRADINGVLHLADDIAGVRPVLPGQLSPSRFSLADVDWSLVPKLQKAARDRLQLPDGHIVFVEISRPGSAVGTPEITWEVPVDSADDSSVSGRVVFDNKGNVVSTRYPRGRGPKLDLLDAASYTPALDALTRALGDHAAIVELDFRPDELMATVKDPQKPDARVVLSYEGKSPARSIMPPLDWPTFGPDWFFDLAEARAVAAHWAELQQDALARLGLADGKVERVTISKQKLQMPRNDRVLIEVRAESGKRGGRVLYDLSGKAVEVVKP
jgi:hypothetical protein